MKPDLEVHSPSFAGAPCSDRSDASGTPARPTAPRRPREASGPDTPSRPGQDVLDGSSGRTAGHGEGVGKRDRASREYSESHILNKFHHSSFLAGAPVQGAGELAVDPGCLVAITNKTGHYKAGTPELIRTLFLLHRAGIPLAQVKLCDPFAFKGKWVSARYYLLAGGEVKDLPGLPPPVRVMP